MTQTQLLIVGGDSDPNTERVVDQAHLRNLDYVFWNTDEPNANQIAWDFRSPEIDLGDQRVRPDAVYLRFNVFGGDSARNHAAFDTIQSFSLAWPSIRILNRANITDANNKSGNLRHAIDVGFTIPDSLIMADLTPLNTLPNPESRVIKPLNGGAHTESVKDICNDLERLAGYSPQFLQERLEGENLRVFSIAGELFCFHLRTTALDYREDNTVEVVQVDVPKSVVEPTHALVKKLNFDYSALDFRCRQSMDDPVFLEINSFPMFVRFDDASQNALVNAILDFLIGN